MDAWLEVERRASEQKTEAGWSQMYAGCHKETVCPGPSFFLAGPLQEGEVGTQPPGVVPGRGRPVDGRMAWLHGQREVTMSQGVRTARASCTEIPAAQVAPSFEKDLWLCESREAQCHLHYPSLTQLRQDGDGRDRPVRGPAPTRAPVLVVPIPTSSCSGRSAVFLREVWSYLSFYR